MVLWMYVCVCVCVCVVAQTGEGIVRCRVFNKHMVVLATPELCKRVLQTNISNYVKGG